MIFQEYTWNKMSDTFNIYFVFEAQWQERIANQSVETCF